MSVVRPIFDIMASGNDMTVGQYYLDGLLSGARRLGLDIPEILAAAGIDRDLFEQPSPRLGGEQLLRLIIALRVALNDEYLGLLPSQGKLEMGYIVGHASLRCENLGHAVRKMANMVSAIRNDFDIDVDIDWIENSVDIVHRVTDLADGTDPHVFHWFTLHWAYKFKCWLIGQPIRLTRVCFATPRPADALNYERLFNCPVEFNSADDRISFPASYLNASIIRTEAEFRAGAFIKEPLDWFVVSGADQSIAARVEQMLLDIYREGLRTPSLELIADQMCCSPRTLSRRLAREDESFQRLKDRVRCDTARKYLVESEMTVADIAERLCFSEPSDFTRAFSAWTGITPSTFRESMRTARAA